MKGHLFLHLGPPKTATTSLQIALQSLDLPNFVYLGAHQPRDPSVTHPSDLIHTFCLHESAALSSELEMFVTTIHKRLEQGGTVVLSEEGFLVWEERAHFWEKLARLEQLFSELPHTYIITVRDPKDALPSYYQELYPRLSVAEKLRPEQFFEHGRCDCYDYQKLKSWFDQRGLAVRLLDFTRLASGSLSLRELLGSACSHDSTLAIPLANAGRRGNDGDDVNSRILPAITLA